MSLPEDKCKNVEENKYQTTTGYMSVEGKIIFERINTLIELSSLFSRNGLTLGNIVL